MAATQLASSGGGIVDEGEHDPRRAPVAEHRAVAEAGYVDDGAVGEPVGGAMRVGRRRDRVVLVGEEERRHVRDHGVVEGGLDRLDVPHLRTRGRRT